jgi:hypothetical protein
MRLARLLLLEQESLYLQRLESTGRANELQAIGDVDQYFAERQHRSLKLLNSTPLFFSG